ncbi:alpha/beta hydrolase [Dermatobacter hominis]|uniref:alpha/beta hydrolase n=1 Tax=Dermatobacter hominis TaxID=2884263 RepID=UPI001D0F6430|nr:alpha/beta hydrolase [Dermatobacter hominis]UDY36489.1 alpha/beta hydrolase [Dermatobacter hominis]
MLDLIAATGAPPPMEAGPEVAREGFALLCAAFGTGPEDVEVEDIEVAGADGPLPARRYRPVALPAEERAPALVFLHGGGFVIGSLDTHDALCRELAVGAEAVVVSVDYRLAPEHPAPAAVHDVDAALADVVARADGLGIDADRVAVGGDSAGGNLAALAALHWSERRRAEPDLPPLRLQVLIYPVTDLVGDHERFASLRTNGEGYLLTAETMDFFMHHYVRSSDVDPTDPSVNPMRVEDLSDVAPALVLTAEYDPLRDEGEAYAVALEAAGVPVESERFDGAIHAFVQMTSTQIGRRAVDRICLALRDALA